MKFKISGISNPQQRRWSVIHWVNSPVNLTVFLFQEEIKMLGNFSRKISQFLIVQIDQPWLWSNSSKGHSLLILWQTTKFTNTDVLVSFTIFVSESNCKMNKEKFIILKRTKTLLRIMKCWIEFWGRRNKKSHSRPNQYQKQIPENVKKEIGKHVPIFGTSPIKRFWLKYPKQSLISSSIINCKIRFKGGPWWWCCSIKGRQAKYFGWPADPKS